MHWRAGPTVTSHSNCEVPGSGLSRSWNLSVVSAPDACSRLSCEWLATSLTKPMSWKIEDANFQLSPWRRIHEATFHLIKMTIIIYCDRLYCTRTGALQPSRVGLFIVLDCFGSDFSLWLWSVLHLNECTFSYSLTCNTQPLILHPGLGLIIRRLRLDASSADASDNIKKWRYKSWRSELIYRSLTDCFKTKIFCLTVSLWPRLYSSNSSWRKFSSVNSEHTISSVNS